MVKGLADKINLNLEERKEGRNIWGVIHQTIHANELIRLPHNQYNCPFKKIKTQIDESLKYFKFKGVTKVLFAVREITSTV